MLRLPSVRRRPPVPDRPAADERLGAALAAWHLRACGYGEALLAHRRRGGPPPDPGAFGLDLAGTRVVTRIVDELDAR